MQGSVLRGKLQILWRKRRRLQDDASTVLPRFAACGSFDPDLIAALADGGGLHSRAVAPPCDVAATVSRGHRCSVWGLSRQAEKKAATTLGSPLGTLEGILNIYFSMLTQKLVKRTESPTCFPHACMK